MAWAGKSLINKNLRKTQKKQQQNQQNRKKTEEKPRKPKKTQICFHFISFQRALRLFVFLWNEMDMNSTLMFFDVFWNVLVSLARVRLTTASNPGESI